MDWLFDLLGVYTQFFIMCAQEAIMLFLYLLALTWYKKKRRFYIARILICFVVSVLLCIPLGILRTHFNIIPVRIFNTAFLLLATLAALFISYREKANEIMLCFAGIIAAKNMSGQIFALLLNMFGVDDLVSMSFFAGYDVVRDWIIYFAIHILLLSGVYIFLRKRENLQDDRSTVRAVSLAAITFLVATVLSTYARAYQAESFALSACIKIFLLIIYAFILIMRSDIFFRSRIKQELYVTEQLLYQEKKHYDEIKNNIDVINMKCHDIKHQLDNFHGRLTERELEGLREAIQIYDSNIKTGNEILDTILFLKRLYCEKNGLRLKFMADGKLLGFVEGNDLYALITNALDNAAESVVKLADEDKRIIDFHVWRENASAVIEVANFFHPETYEGATAKEDKVHHGYGIRSMKYITQKYGGTLSISRENNIFTLTITLPVRDLKQDKKIYR